MSNEEILEKKQLLVALDKHMMHVTISYPYLTISYLHTIYGTRRRCCKC